MNSLSQNEDAVRRGPTSLDAIADDPTRLANTPTREAVALMVRCSVVHAALAARIISESVSTKERGAPEIADDRLLTPQEAAAVLSVPIPWLYRHAPRLPFTRRLSRKRLRFSELGLRNYLAKPPR